MQSLRQGTAQVARGGGERVLRLSPEGRAHFFGYYDRCPWDLSNRWVLGLGVSGVTRPPSADDTAALTVLDSCGDEPARELGMTAAWNYQQGCLATWLPDGNLIHNDRRDGRFVAVIRDLQGKELQQVPRPVYAVAADGRTGLSLNFSRLARTRPGYGYAGVPDPTGGDLCPLDDGVWRVDLVSGRSDQIVSLRGLAEFEPSRGMAGAEHWVNHLMFNPSGTRFAFVHRWRTPQRSEAARAVARHRTRSGLVRGARRLAGELYRRATGRRFAGLQTRLFTANADGSDVRCLLADGTVSHYGWRDDGQLLAWATKRPLGDRYWLIDDRTGSADAVGEGVLTCDGHCTYSQEGRWVLTDTYPDRQGEQSLILYDVAESRRIDVGRFRAAPELTGELRCDLHPRFDRECRRICIDSAHAGTRQMYCVDVAEWMQP